MVAKFILIVFWLETIFRNYYLWAIICTSLKASLQRIIQLIYPYRSLSKSLKLGAFSPPFNDSTSPFQRGRQTLPNPHCLTFHDSAIYRRTFTKQCLQKRFHFWKKKKHIFLWTLEVCCGVQMNPSAISNICFFSYSAENKLES